MNKKIVAISCGETHTLALTDSGHLYSFGGNTCGQLGQFNPSPFGISGDGTQGSSQGDKKRNTSIDEFQIVFPKPHHASTNSLGRAPSVSDSFCGNDYD